MREARRHQRLVMESVGRGGAVDHVVANHLNGDSPFERAVARLVHGAHPAAPEPLVNRVATAEDPRNVHADECRPILRAPGHVDVVTGPHRGHSTKASSISPSSGRRSSSTARLAATDVTSSRSSRSYGSSERLVPSTSNASR